MRCVVVSEDAMMDWQLELDDRYFFDAFFALVSVQLPLDMSVAYHWCR